MGGSYLKKIKALLLSFIAFLLTTATGGCLTFCTIWLLAIRPSIPAPDGGAYIMIALLLFGGAFSLLMGVVVAILVFRKMLRRTGQARGLREL